MHVITISFKLTFLAKSVDRGPRYFRLYITKHCFALSIAYAKHCEKCQL